MSFIRAVSQGVSQSEGGIFKSSYLNQIMLQCNESIDIASQRADQIKLQILPHTGWNAESVCTEYSVWLVLPAVNESHYITPIVRVVV